MGFGSIVGGIGGALIGGPAGAAAGYMLGNEVDKNNKKGAAVPGYRGPQFAMKKTEDFIKEEPRVEIGGAGSKDAMQRRFQQAKEGAIGQVNAGHSQARNAIQRRFASMGAQGSGAQLKLEQQMADQLERQKIEATQGIDAAQEDAIFKREAAQADSDFRGKQFAFEKGSKMHELDLAERQQQISQSENAYAAQMNSFMNQPPKKGLISGLLDGIL